MALLRPLAAWLLILVFAMLNGGFREAVLLPNLGKPAALALSGALLSACILIVAVVLARWLKLDDTARSLAVGSIWLVLTLAFEFGFGRLVEGRSWPEMLEAYTFKDGNIWPLVLLVTFIAPLVALRIRGPGRSAGAPAGPHSRAPADRSKRADPDDCPGVGGARRRSR